MSRFVFFSFAYDDVKNFKVNVVRNSWRLNNNDETFIDGSMWETAKSKGEVHLKNLIQAGLVKTSVTAILIGEDTIRRWVNYEIVKSFERGNGILGIHINRIRGTTGLTSRGLNPLDRLGFQVSDDGRKIRFYELLNRKWRVYTDLPEINNKKSNTLYFEDGWFSNDFGEFFKFSEKFKTYCWINDKGHDDFTSWVEAAADQAGR